MAWPGISAGLRAALLVVLLLLGGAFTAAAAPPPVAAATRPPVAAARAETPAPRPVEIWLYSNLATRAQFERQGGRHETYLDWWADYFEHSGTKFRLVDRSVLLAAQRPAVLILPSVLVLDDEERRALKRFLDLGGSVLTTWKTGWFDAEGHERGDEFLREALGVRIAGEIGREQRHWFLVPYGEQPVTHPIPASQRIWLGQTDEPLLRVEAAHLAGRFTGFEYISPEDGEVSGAMAFDERGRGRVVYLGFAETGWRTGSEWLYRFLPATLAWLARQPEVFKAAWPAPYRAAQLLEMDTEWQFENAGRFAAMLDGINARGTFYCLTSEARKHPELLLRLSQRHEIGFHGDVHEGFQDLPEAEQNRRLDRMLAEMAATLDEAGVKGAQPTWWERLRALFDGLLARLGLRPKAAAPAPRRPVLPGAHHFTGFRAPTESFDLNTERALRRRGITHHATDPNRTDYQLPGFSDAEGVGLPAALPPEGAVPGLGRPGAGEGLDTDSAIVRLPRTQRDDVNFRRWGYSRSRIAQALLADFRLALDTGGLSLLSVHSQFYGPGGPMTETLPTLLAELQRHRDRVWVGAAGDIAHWWRQRARVSHKVEAHVHGLELEVTVRPGEAVKKPSFVVTVPHRNAVPRVEASGPYAMLYPAPSAVRRIDEWRWAIDFDTLSKSTYRYEIRF
ncbi:MAG: hypothetical protein HY778_16300 [Betaproteobacteria bacterium]|nr:hypothetical protein [Betaproteobacteria bacterium]